MTRKQKRLTGIGVIALVIASAVGLVLYALNDEIVFFYSPTDIQLNAKAQPGQRFRLGGLVKEKTVHKEGVKTVFVITDNANDLTVSYTGVLPDLFREGQGVVAEGILNEQSVFVADTVLAKHDEKYIPKEIVDTMKKQGTWQGDET